MSTKQKKGSEGKEFERQVAASAPPWATVQKLPDPPPHGRACRMCKSPLATRCTRCGTPSPATFTQKPPYDFHVTAPTRAGESAPQVQLLNQAEAGPAWVYGLRPTISWALECKSVQGNALPSDKVLPHQVAALLAAARAGCWAGLLVEWRSVDEVWFVPIAAYLDYLERAARSSLSLAEARHVGLRLAVDANRGTRHTYYRLDLFLAAFGAGPSVQAALPLED